MAQSIVQHLSVSFEHTKYQDDYRNRLQQVIAKKIQGEEILKNEVAHPKSNVLDLISALQASLDALDNKSSSKSIKPKGKRKKEQNSMIS
ncbi:hypothetical protein NQ117_02870 [Paenibacillus sp. SC116]|uniref:hypothetical protein n=1 Tax=Paenibacillus sp. SC116 TaxID=2968986 RepID=UPI00215B06B2|nr:hypothetical protein [Paenibacillus sp. SC116]MCR8842613.1 hypothetical protein [Paenibacillus sp. SC116]